ncbi:MAG: methylated-DNA--[protein]-cysteine S-methyltransferase [Ligilactobacillus agilis]|nr:methylated-DNA--[protein]-cysteine S-methyltransferase [Ligilactobacillus agilis]
MLLKTTYQSPLGVMTILADEHFLLGCWFDGQKYFGAHYDLTTIPHGENTILKQTKNWLAQYFAGQNPNPKSLPIKIVGTPYQQKILRTLITVPYGHTISYQDLANLANHHQPAAARPVGHAVSHNPFLIIIPCHRVIGSRGKITGYAAGIERKITLLQLEKLK